MNAADSPWPGFACPSRQPAAERDAEAVATLLRLARGLADTGRRMDLGGLDQMVGRLVAACLDLPPEEGRTLRPRLAGLLVEIDALQGVLVRPGADGPP